MGTREVARVTAQTALMRRRLSEVMMGSFSRGRRDEFLLTAPFSPHIDSVPRAVTFPIKSDFSHSLPLLTRVRPFFYK